MSRLVRAELHAQHLPADLEPLIVALQKFQQDVNAWRVMENGRAKDQAAAALELAHTEIVTAARYVLPLDSDEMSKTIADDAIVSGALRLIGYEETVRGGNGVVDHFGSKTLDEFETDFKGDPAILRAALSSVFGLEAVDSLHVQHDIDAEFGALNLRQRIMNAISGFAESKSELGAAALLRLCYPKAPPGLNPRVIQTGTSLFFCLEFNDSSDASDEHRGFSEKVGRLKQRYMAHFPVFGFFRGEHADVDFVAAVARAVGLSYRECCEVLTTMVSIIPACDVDKYIIHDAWGHQWQALLFDFENSYKETASYRRIPKLSDPMFNNAVTTVAESMADNIEPDFEGWDQFLNETLSDRLVLSLSGLFAEVLADALEYKFLWINPELRSQMPSSSVLKLRPAKLDLTLHDLPLYCEFALKGFARFASSPEYRDEFVTDFRNTFSDYSDEVAQKTANAIADRTSFWLKTVYEPELSFSTNSDGTISTNVYTRIAINFLAMEVALNDTIDRLCKTDLPSTTLVRFFDLLIFSCASFFEMDRPANFWLLDEFLKLGFESRYSELQRTLNSSNA